ncbi:MAG: TonB-dependent receptor [Labilibaculum sp.]|nr:TonB-dependent receptor [Labilibaculum sp.]MBI9057337.1 TonB-dependent receptor [Labilibaculum sp.]
MKLSVLLIVIFTTVVSAESFSQNELVTLKMSDATVVEIFKEIEVQSGLGFFFKTSDFNTNELFSVDVDQMPVDQVVHQIFKDEELEVNYEHKNVIIKKANVVLQEQNITVTGKITDDNGNPLPGVTVIIKGTSKGTISNPDGVYSFSNIPEGTILEFSFIGMVTQEVRVGSKKTINVSMTDDTIGLDEVIAIGYGSMKKSDLTGAVSSVSSKELAAFPSLGVSQALQGRAAGVQIQSNNGEPGSSLRMRIRGGTSINSTSEPLYVVDGFPGGIMPPAEDIASIEILKDASATSIYGSRGANGVVMITTKKGSDSKPTISFNSSYSSQDVINKIDLLNKNQFTEYVQEIDPNALNGSIIGSGTNWQDELFRKGSIQNHQLSISGGNDGIKYYVSGILYDQEGIVINSTYKRYSLTSNINIKASEKFNMGLNVFARRSVKNGVSTQQGSGRGVTSSAVTAEPTLPVYNDKGEYAISWFGDPNDNPIAMSNEPKNEVITDWLQANMFGEYALLNDLKFKFTLGANTSNSQNGSFLPSTLIVGKAVGGSASMSSIKNTSISSENYFTYSKKIGDHDITAMGGYSYSRNKNASFSTKTESFLTDAFLWWDLGGGAEFKNDYSSLTETELSSYYGRINYKLLDRYMLTVNARYDGSSRFAKNNKWAFFPSAAIAWNVAEESFLQDVEEVSQFKIRASYGVTGNQGIGPYQSLAKYSSIHVIQNSSIVNAARPAEVANDNLTWESTAQTDIGFDLGLFNQRIHLVADYYYKKTTDLLFSMPLPEYSGYWNTLKNIGSIENKGFEFALSTVNFDGEFKWTTDINFSTNKNKVLSLPDEKDIFYRVMPGHLVGISNTNILREGEAVGAFYGYVYDGVSQEGETILPGTWDTYAGGEKYKDINGVKDADGNLTGEADGKIDGNDRTIIGDPNPDFIYGINNTFSYKGFDLNIFMQGSQGNDMYSFTLMELETLRGVANSTTEALNRWTPTNTNTNVPKASSTSGYHSSSRWIFDGSYLRVKNIALGYNLPESALKSLGLSKVRFYVSGQNLYTFTKYRGFDPEVNYSTDASAGGNMNVGFDYGAYPNAKSYTVGLKVTF